ncbi:MAG: M56 family metallopeptidase, partial [Bacteroidota bacterium]
MSLIFLYLLKLSLSLSLVYLFYHFVLRRLTFYNWNRFYLLCYTAISFFFPFINITPVLERNEIADNQLIRFIPAVGNIKTKLTGELPGKAAAFSWSSLDWLLFFVLTGIVLMLIRLIIQLISFRKIINNAKLVSNTHVKLYQVNQSIIPFSFGNSIFINQQLHNDDELTEIIRHEFVHVKQKHTVDIIWTELLCILNWYNPFIWMIRKAIRQNLEFIADQKVLQSGIDRKEYQYLLLKVIGNNHFSIASQFNFSSLKKRIAMMNKMKSAKAHLIKFLFLLPLMAILILSFRNKIRDEVLKNPEKIFSLSGIVYDNKTELPLSNVIMIEQASGNQTKTDANGFYKIAIPILSEEKQRITINFSKPGYRYNERRIEVDTYADRYCLGFFSLLTEDNAGDDINHAYFYSVKDNNGNMITNPGYDFVKDRFENHFRKNITNDIFYEKGIYSLEDIKLEQLGIAGKDTVPTGSLLNSKGYFVDITGDKGNCTVVIKDKIHKEVKRVLLNDWKKNSNYYINLYGPLPVESKDSQVEVVSEDSKPVIYEVEDNTVSKEFKRLELNDNLLATVTLNNGKIEKYDLNKEADKKVFEKKYGPVISALPK